MTTLVTLMKSSKSVDQRALVRAAIPLLYAHWEGFGRVCISRYLELISYRRIKFKNLKPAFLYMASVGSLAEIDRSSYRDAIALLNSVLERADKPNKDTFRKRVNTRSNLRFDVLVDLLSMCGLDVSDFEDDKTFINDELCDPRNEIAHGVGGAPFLDTFLQRRDKTFELMKKLQVHIVNAAVTQAYKV